MIANPYDDLLSKLASAVKSALRNAPDLETIKLLIEEPPSRKFGDLGIPLPRIAKLSGLNVEECSSVLTKALQELNIIKKINRIGPYLDLFIDVSKYSAQVLLSVKELGNEYGVIKHDRPLKIVVEYVSANPIHPLHIGSGRNAVLGDFIYRALRLAGHSVERRYYVDDVGLQVAYLAYGYLKLGRPNPPRGFKPDVYYGLIYAATSIIVDIIKAKREAERLRREGSDKYFEVLRRIDELMADLARIKERIPNEVDKLIDEIMKDQNPEESIANLMRDYEFGKPGSDVVKEVAEKVMMGIKDTLSRLGIEMDKWDWESDLIREGLVSRVLEEARKSPFYSIHKGVPALNFNDLLKDAQVRQKLRIPEGLEVPPLILMRADGTTLYTTRDIAYTIKKFSESEADLVYNVIAIEQTLPQAQLRLALYALGYRREAERTIHYSYEMVNLVGTSMSGRRGRYVTVDEVLDSLKMRILKIMEGRGSKDPEVAEKMARSALKYIMLSVSPNKVLVFDINQAVNIKQSSGPYIQYTYARAKAVLSKAGGVPWSKISFEGAGEGLRRELIWLIGKFPQVMYNTISRLRPEDLASYMCKLADVFNRWYGMEAIAKERDEGLRALKLAITYGVATALSTGMKVLGMDVLERV